MKKISKKMSKGFTLLEMLVVVLIIGILAGIALPQYNRAVEKTRLAEALLTASSLQRAIDVYTLTDYPSSRVNFLNDDPDATLDIDITENLGCDGHGCGTKDFNYYAYCDNSSCFIEVARNLDGNVEGLWTAWLAYKVIYQKNKGENTWTKYCDYTDGKYDYIAAYLESMGIERGEAC